MLVKICGLTRQIDLDLASDLGADFCGFIFDAASPRYVSPAQAGALLSHGLKRVGVFTQMDAEEIIRIMSEARLDYAQLHGAQEVETARKIGMERVIKVLWPQKYNAPEDILRDARDFAADCSYFLLDSGLRGGGSGATIDWTELADMRLPRPWLLAGALNKDNALKAVNYCHPCGLDFNSGLEDAPGIKNGEQMKKVMAMLYKLNR